MSILDYHDPVGWRFYIYGEDDDGDPLFSLYMDLDEDMGICIYDRNGGHGKVHSTHHSDDEYDPIRPSEAFKDCLRDAIDSEHGVAREDVLALDAHEEYFFRVLHGTIEQKEHASEELLAFIADAVGFEVTTQ